MLVGSILAQKSLSLIKQIEKLSPDFFYFKSNSLLYQVSLEVINKIQKTSLEDFFKVLKAKNLIEELGGLENIIHVIESAPASNLTKEYSSIILDNYIKRLLLISGDSLCLLSCSKEQITQSNITLIANQLTKAYEILENKEVETLATPLASLLSDLDTTKTININSGIPSGFHKLDSITQGFQKSDLIIIAGRPSMGKTAFAVNITRHIIKSSNSCVILFSLEMSTEQLLKRILAQECHINSQKIQSNQLSSREWGNVIKGTKTLSNLNLYIDDSAEVSPNIIRRKIKFLKLQGKNIELIIIDYLQLLQDDQQKDNRSQELSSITRSLKILARELNLPILLLSQLNRNLESRSDKRPLLSDLRESGCISKFSYISSKNGIKSFLNYHKKTFQINNFNQQAVKTFTPGKAYISKTGKKPIYKIITESNKHLELTSNHKILTLYGWKRCDKLQKNEMIAIQIQYIKKKEYIFNYFSSLYLTFETLKQINITNLQNVIDCVCNPLRNFIANNIIVHNSIEQDADLVIMLYRESYYNKETNDEGSTEIIVSKHRNGPVGTVALGFDAKLANFSNI